MARVTDTLFVGFAISPDHPLRREVDPSSVDVKVIATRQFQQCAEYNVVLQKLTDIVKEQLAIHHAYTFRQ